MYTCVHFLPIPKQTAHVHSVTRPNTKAFLWVEICRRRRGFFLDLADLGGDLSACLNALAHAAGQSLFVLKPEHARHLSTVQQVVNVLQAFKLST